MGPGKTFTGVGERLVGSIEFTDIAATRIDDSFVVDEAVFLFLAPLGLRFPCRMGLSWSIAHTVLPNLI